MRRLLKPLWILLALVFLFEAWLWSRLAALVTRLVALIDLPRLKARIGAAIERLPPAATLVVFIVPVLVMRPMKFVGLWPAGARLLARRDSGARPGEGRQHGARRVHFRRDSARNYCSSPGSAGSTSACWQALIGRTGRSIRSNGA